MLRRQKQGKALVLMFPEKPVFEQRAARGEQFLAIGGGQGGGGEELLGSGAAWP
jgi:hypothetical protein